MKKINHILLVVIMVFATSCSSDFLDREPSEQIRDEKFLSTLIDYQTAVVGVHNQLQNSNTYGRYFVLVPDVMGEDVKQADDANRGKEWAEYEGDFTHFIPENIWREFYEAINITNQVINSDKYEPIPDDQAAYDQAVGQAHALRALIYFDLVRMYAQPYNYTSDASHMGVPIVTEHNIEGLPSRNTVSEVYDQIIDDFNTGIALMTLEEKQYYMSRQAAQALLSRVYLYKEDYRRAIDLATAVIDDGSYELAEGDDYLRQFLKGESDEAIFEIAYNTTDNPGSDHLGGMYKATGYGDYFPSQDLLDLITDGDIRKTTVDKDPEVPSMFLIDKDGDIRVNKYPSFDATIYTDAIPVIRLSEVYLNRAEARAKASGADRDEAGAQADLNMIRKRGLATAPDVTAIGDALIAEILIERRIELCFEGHRIFDVNRNRQDVVRDDCTSNICTITYPNDRFILPIPDGETDVNPNITQNPGY
jgi:hypothetical protein